MYIYICICRKCSFETYATYEVFFFMYDSAVVSITCIFT